MIFLCIGVSDILGLSSLLACMMMSGVLVNISTEIDVMFPIVDRLTPPIFMLFFVISGAELNIGIIPTIGVVGAIYIVFRVAGKALRCV